MKLVEENEAKIEFLEDNLNLINNQMLDIKKTKKKLNEDFDNRVNKCNKIFNIIVLVVVIVIGALSLDIILDPSLFSLLNGVGIISLGVLIPIVRKDIDRSFERYKDELLCNLSEFDEQMIDLENVRLKREQILRVRRILSNILENKKILFNDEFNLEQILNSDEKILSDFSAEELSNLVKFIKNDNLKEKIPELLETFEYNKEEGYQKVLK